MESEKHLQTYLFKQAKANDIYCRKMAAVGRRGFPDVFLAYNGYTIFLELKSPSGRGKLSPLQLREIEQMRMAGVGVWVINQKEQVDAIIRELVDPHSRYFN
jgi:hypothetical protein